MSTIGQEIEKYKALKQYHRFGITMGPHFIIKEKSNLNSGIIPLRTLILLALMQDLSMIFRPTKVWSIQTGVFVGYEPAYNISVKIPIEEISLVNTEDFVLKWKKFGQYSVSVPVLLV